MHTLPRLEQGEQNAALSCPDCAGTLSVRVEGAWGHLHFECRIGHGYGLGSLLEAKEAAVEQRLWSALVSMEELAELLQELQTAGEPYTAGHEWAAATVRITQLRASVAALRSIIDRGEAIDLGLDAGLDRSPSC